MDKPIEDLATKALRSLLESRRGGAGGAFGRDRATAWDFTRPRHAQSGSMRDENRFKNIGDRVKFGKNMENRILDALEAQGFELQRASIEEDMHDKIDGWWKFENQNLPMQVKYRDSGNDILLEVVNPLMPKMLEGNTLPMTGRDMVGKATIYACLSQDGATIRIRSAKEAKQVAENMAKKLLSDYKLMRKMSLTVREGQIRITTDPRSQVQKVVAYIDPDAFQVKKDIHLPKSLWMN